MFSWLPRRLSSARRSALAAASGDAGQNPGRAKPIEATNGRAAFDNGQRTWDETFDCENSLTEVLRRLGRDVTVRDNRVLDESTGLWLRPVLVDMQPIHNKGVRTCTKIYVTHPAAIPKAVFEFQHSTGGSITESIEAGFEAWSRSDMVALADAIRDHAQECMVMLLETPAKVERLASKRRVVLGPVAHFQQRPTAQDEDHPFCPCCLLTNSMEAFQALLNSDGFFAVRLYAMRGEDGIADADCRVNGEDFEPGREALKQYSLTWPQSGVEFRKQYVVIQQAPQR